MSIRVAILSSHGFGDGLIQLSMARLLQLNGFEVDYYNDFVAQLRSLINGIGIHSFPDYGDARRQLEKFDFILYDSNSNFVNAAPPELDHWLAHNGICYSLARSRPRHREITVEGLQRRCRSEAGKLASRFIRLNRSFRGLRQSISRQPMALHLINLLAKELELKRVDQGCALQLPADVEARDSRRVVIHPTSSSPRKNWLPGQFMQLAGQLAAQGWNPVFTVSPAESPQWDEIVGQRFGLVAFDDIEQLARYYAGSGAFIGNDSGNAHLASCLGLPCLVIYGRFKKYPVWRPAWGRVRIVAPEFPPGRRWQAKVPVERVYRTFTELLSDNSLSS